MSIGSSHFFSVSGSTGPDGPQGPIGPIGPAGPTGLGVTGATGNTGATLTSFIVTLSSSSVTSDILTVSIGNTGFTFDASSIRGATVHFGQGITVENNLTGISLFSGISYIGPVGNTGSARFLFKNIESSTAGIQVTSDADFITINATAGTLSLGAPNQSKGILYFESPSTTKFTDYGFTGSTGSLYLQLNSTAGSSNSILFTNRSLTSSGRTADINSILEYNGTNITGFTGFALANGTTGEISTFAFIVTDGLTGLPSSVLLRPEHAVLYPGKNIVVLTTINSGSSFSAEIFHAGYDSKGNIPAYTQGACYFSNGSLSTCFDYINAKDCVIGASGKFFPYKTCQEAAPAGTSFELGTCCIRGLCTRVPKNLCLRWGGIYHGATSCSNVTCANPCST